jgi:hypothetical protein
MPPRHERVEFWKHAYARASFIDAQIFLEELLNQKPEPFSPSRKLFTIAILTVYARPFKQRPAVRLEDGVVSAEYRQAHNWAIEHRDKVVAHRDLDAGVTTWGFINQLRLVTDEIGFKIYTLSPYMSDEMARDLLALVKMLIRIMDERTEPFIKEWVRTTPRPPGEYVINLKDDVPLNWIEPARERNIYLPNE